MLDGGCSTAASPLIRVSRSDSDLFRAIQAGAVGYLLKDQSLHQIAAVLWRVLDGEALLS